MRIYGPMAMNVWAFGVGALSMLPLSYHVLAGFHWSAPGWAGWLGLLYLSFMTSVISFSLWSYALKTLEATQVAVFTNLQPAFTAILVWLFLGEVPGLAVVVGMVLVAVGVMLSQWRRQPTLMVNVE